MLGFLEKLTLTPAQITNEDVKPLRDQGLSTEAIEDAIYICAFFNIIVRIADTLAFAVPPTEMLAKRAPAMLGRGYTLTETSEHT